MHKTFQLMLTLVLWTLGSVSVSLGAAEESPDQTLNNKFNPALYVDEPDGVQTNSNAENPLLPSAKNLAIDALSETPPSMVTGEDFEKHSYDLSYGEGSLSFHPLIEKAKTASLPSSAKEALLAKTNADNATKKVGVGGGATIQMNDQMNLSMDYLLSRSGTSPEAAPIAGPSQQQQNQQMINLNMKYNF